MSTTVVRFSSFGDVVLCGAVTGALAPVHFVTHERYAALAARLPGVVEVIALAQGESVSALRRRLPPTDRVVDLHGSLRSRALVPAADRVTSHRIRRWGRVAWKGEPAPRVIDRYARAAGVAPAPQPWIPLEARTPERLALAPGAAHATKRWARERFVELGRSWDGACVVLGGPGEEALCKAIGREISAEVLVESGIERTIEVLASVHAMVVGDTGLMHLAGACGVPVVGLFGPTHPDDGFWCHAGEAVHRGLTCSPCSRFGGSTCPIGDHACLAALGVQEVRAAVDRVAPR